MLAVMPSTPETQGTQPENTALAQEVEAFRDAARFYSAMLLGWDLLERKDLELIRESAVHFWRAATHGWSAERHARVYLLELLREPPAAAGWASEKLPEYLRSHVEAVRRVFELDCPGVTETTAEDRAVWFSFWLFYPEPARRLTRGELDRAGRLLRGEEPNKWFELADFFERIGLGGVKHESLATDDRKWKRLKARSHVSARSPAEND